LELRLIEQPVEISEMAIKAGAGFSGSVDAASAEGDDARDDFVLLVREHQQRIYRLLLSILRDPEAAETLTQDCFVKAFQGWSGFRGEAQAGTWLTRIAINLARDYMRNRRLMFWRRVSQRGEDATELAGVLPDKRSSAEQQLLSREKLGAVWKAVAKLSLRQRTIFVLRFVEEMENEEIAAMLGLRPATVRLHLFRAVHAVQKAVQS
jgi:RNA polymerase sigma-70 factor (ECF subfamily)